MYCDGERRPCTVSMSPNKPGSVGLADLLLEADIGPQNQSSERRWSRGCGGGQKQRNRYKKGHQKGEDGAARGWERKRKREGGEQTMWKRRVCRHSIVVKGDDGGKEGLVPETQSREKQTERSSEGWDGLQKRRKNEEQRSLHSRRGAKGWTTTEGWERRRKKQGQRGCQGTETGNKNGRSCQQKGKDTLAKN